MASLTFADYKRNVKHILGADPEAIYTDVDTTKGQVVNEAGRWMTLAQEWAWRRSEAVDLAFVPGQAYVPLPTDFLTILGAGVIVNDSVNYSFEWGDISELEFRRSQQIFDTKHYFGAMEWPNQPSKSDPMSAPRLALHPTPGESSSSGTGLRLTYKRGWSELNSDTDVPNIPKQFESLLLYCVKAFSQDQEYEDIRMHTRTLEGIMQSAMFQSMVRQDANQQPNIGAVLGGQFEPMNSRSRLPFSSVAGPN
tara:strand:- start:43798 stop:44553 length:756 start_codon:yes stop_codon:yes gene_type:complete